MENAAGDGHAQCLTFRLDNELFAINIARVREVLEFSTVTKVPRMPDFMCGVINLRGSAVPVVDMRIKLGMLPAERTPDTCVVITEVMVDGENVVLGALVDSVQEVLALDDREMLSPPRIGGRLDTRAIHGMGRHDDAFVMVLDIDEIFPPGDVNAIPAA
jgi:purine-binding chemotaxis protein CheW